MPNQLTSKITALRDDLLAEHLGVQPDIVKAKLGHTRSLIDTIEELSGSGRSLYPYEIPDLSSAEEWLAENEILDPNGPDELFEFASNGSLFNGWDQIRKRFLS